MYFNERILQYKSSICLIFEKTINNKQYKNINNKSI